MRGDRQTNYNIVQKKISGRVKGAITIPRKKSGGEGGAKESENASG